MNKLLLLSVFTTLFLFTACSSKNELVTITVDGKQGIIKSDGNIIVKPEYEEIQNIEDINNKNIRTKSMHPINLHWIHNYNGELYSIVKKEGKYGIISSENEVLVKPQYDSISKEFNGYFKVEKNKSYGLVDTDFKLLQKETYQDIIINSKLVFLKSNNKWSCLNEDNKLKQKETFDEIYPFINGFARFVQNNKWGFIDEDCEIVAKAKYDYAYDYSNGFAKIVTEEKTSYIDEEGEQILSPSFSSGQNF